MWIVKNTNKTKSLFLHPILLPVFIFIPTFTSASSPQVTEGNGERELWSIHDTSFLVLLLLMLFPCSSIESPLQDTILNTVLQHGSFQWGTVLQEWTASERLQVMPENLLLCGFFSMDPSAWNNSSPTLSLHNLQLQITTTCFNADSPRGCRWISAPLCSPMGCRAQQPWLTVLLPTGCKRISALGPGATPLPPSTLTSVSAGLFLPHISHSSNSCNTTLFTLS